ncbi:hypothetical protein [Planococcus sp. YIM B11945]|uniref:hypothetical protein n=1 Tax=Planococcus sp. YIM B11945 TaxID=3435410 RepID=UPI003D7C529A
MKEHTFIVYHAAVHPSFRNEGIIHQIVENVQRLHGPLALCPTKETNEFLTK